MGTDCGKGEPSLSVHGGKENSPGEGSVPRRIRTGFGVSGGTFLVSFWEFSVGGSLWGLEGQDTLSIYFVKTINCG